MLTPDDRLVIIVLVVMLVAPLLMIDINPSDWVASWLSDLMNRAFNFNR